MAENEVKEEVKVEPVAQAEAPSAPEVQKEAPKSEAPKTEVEEAPKKEKKYVPLDEVIKERHRRREAEKRLQDLEDRVNKLSAEDPVKKIAQDFSVDEDTARKLHTHFGQKPNVTTHSAEESLKEDFQAKCEDYASVHDDWFEHKAEMEKLFSADAEKQGLVAALKNDPEKYYLKAKLLRRQDPEKARQEGAREVVNQLNQQNLAGAESAKNSSPKPTAGPKWSREKLKNLSHAEYLKHEKEIKLALSRGEIQ